MSHRKHEYYSNLSQAVSYVCHCICSLPCSNNKNIYLSPQYAILKSVHQMLPSRKVHRRAKYQPRSLPSPVKSTNQSNLTSTNHSCSQEHRRGRNIFNTTLTERCVSWMLTRKGIRLAKGSLVDNNSSYVIDQLQTKRRSCLVVKQNYKRRKDVML